MKARPQRQEKIIGFLSKNKNGKFQEMFKGLKMGRGCLAMGLDELETEGIIKKDDKNYSIQTNPTKNKKIKIVDKNDLMNYDLEECMEALKKDKMPFEVGYVLLRHAMFSLPKLTLEINSTRIIKSERDRLKKMIERYNQTIKRTFEVLEEIDYTKVLTLKQGLEASLTVPKFDFKAAGLANKRQKNRARRI